MVRMTQMDRVTNKDLHKRVGIESELVGRVDHTVLRCFGYIGENG